MGYSEIGNKIRAERLKIGFTQAELCGDKLTRTMLSRIENGLALPSVENLCYIASKLELPPGYFIDDSVSEENIHDFRLKKLIVSEFKNRDYRLCLEYIESLIETDGEIELIKCVSLYNCGIEDFFECSLSSAEKYFELVISFSKSDYPVSAYVSDARVLFALIKSFKKLNEQGEEEKLFASVLGCASSDSDILKISEIIEMQNNFGTDGAERLLSFKRFKDKNCFSFCQGYIAFKRGAFFNARVRLLEALSDKLLPPIVCFAYTMLEKCSAGLKDFESAYMFSLKRRELVSKLIDNG